MKFPLSLDLRKQSINKPGVDIIDADQALVVNLSLVGDYAVAGKIVDLLNMVPVLMEALEKSAGTINLLSESGRVTEGTVVTFTGEAAHYGKLTIGTILDQDEDVLKKIMELVR